MAKKHKGEEFDERHDLDATEEARARIDKKDMSAIRRPDTEDPDRRQIIRGEHQESRHNKPRDD